MFKNYLLIAYRNLLKHKSFSLINISGLAIGMSICLLILQYVSFKLSFDQFNDRVKDLYRVVNDRYQNGKLIQHGTITYSGISKAMQHDFPEVENYSRVRPNGPSIFIDKIHDKKLGDQNGFLVDPSFLQMFNYKLISGDPVTSLVEPRSILLTQSLAKKLFGVSTNQESLIGKPVTIDQDERPFKITGILEDSPINSHLKFDFLESYNTLYSGANSWKDADYNFTSSDFWHYILLKPRTDYKSIDAKMPAFSERYFQGNKISGSNEKFYLQPLSKAHLYSDFEYEVGQTGSATVVWSLLIVALFIIIIAWVNYINLATARAVERAGEVGIRKTIGGAKSQLVIQFFTESILLNLISIIIALGLVFIFQHRFNQLLQSHLSLSYLFTKGLHGYTIPIALMLTFLLGILLSGFYPAFVLSSFNPIEV
ncbi:MAG: ABC transporter permease, partial [Saprospiraceae bacterium]